MSRFSECSLSFCFPATYLTPSWFCFSSWLGLVPDKEVRVSVKALAVSCVGAAAALLPEAFFSSLYQEPLEGLPSDGESADPLRGKGPVSQSTPWGHDQTRICVPSPHRAAVRDRHPEVRRPRRPADPGIHCHPVRDGHPFRPHQDPVQCGTLVGCGENLNGCVSRMEMDNQNGCFKIETHRRI